MPCLRKGLTAKCYEIFIKWFRSSGILTGSQTCCQALQWLSRFRSSGILTGNQTISQARYTVTHEYGHMLENTLYTKAKSRGYRGSLNQYAAKVKREVSAIATKKHGASKNSSPSGYGNKNAKEFFAESFASANLGRPSAYGKAMNDWLSANI